MGSTTLKGWGLAGINQSRRKEQQLSAAELSFAGWVAILAVATTVPRLTFEIVLGALTGGAVIAHLGLRTLEAVLGVYLLLSLRRLLKGRFSFRSADSVIAWWTAFGAFFCAMNILLPRWSGTAVELPALVGAITLGAILDISLGVMLFRLREDPHGGLTAYAFSHIAAGLCVILSTLH